MARRRAKHKSFKWGAAVLLLAVLAGAAYVYTATEFERNAPRITFEQQRFWNLKEPLKINLSDAYGLKSYEVLLSDGSKSVLVGKGTIEHGAKESALKVSYPKRKGVLDPKADRIVVTVRAYDASKWNFFRGNEATKEVTLAVDTRAPIVTVLSNSYGITQGGSALVVFQAEDDHLKEVTIKTPYNRFKARPYKKEGYYAALIAWPFTEDSFDAKIVAVDEAGNKRIVKIPFYLKSKRYRNSWIRAKDSFIDGKISDLAASNSDYAAIKDRIEKFKAINETMRLQNEALIHNLASNVGEGVLTSWKIERFHPLRGSVKVANFGDHRHYYYGDRRNEISTSYHVGYDLASTKMAPIYASNPGKVVFAGENGIYGLMPLIDHGMGLYTLYGHCSKLLVEEGDEVKKNQIIARTGTSGLALGDHLHFGILVQGVEVRPIEWFDAKWIKTNIDTVFKEADKIIEGK